MPDVTVVDHPAAAAMLARLRDEETGPEAFRDAAARLGSLLAYEATRELPSRDVVVSTPVGTAQARVPARRVVAVPVLRAGLGLLPGVHVVLPEAEVGMIGLERDEDTLEAREYYRKVPPLEGAWVLILEPMLATGGSASAAVQVFAGEGAERITVLSVVATERGLQRVTDDTPGTHVVTAAVDPTLDDRGFVVPGLGDFGDRVFFTPR
ncbi:MAG TPA: uracil phosphoribosyltransferase [Nitriliruptorales bacterium]